MHNNYDNFYDNSFKKKLSDYNEEINKSSDEEKEVSQTNSLKYKCEEENDRSDTYT